MTDDTILSVCISIVETTITYLKENMEYNDVDNVPNQFFNSFISKINFHFEYYESLGINRNDVLGEFITDHLPIILKDYLPMLQLHNGCFDNKLYEQLKPNLYKLKQLYLRSI